MVGLAVEGLGGEGEELEVAEVFVDPGCGHDDSDAGRDHESEAEPAFAGDDTPGGDSGVDECEDDRAPHRIATFVEVVENHEKGHEDEEEEGCDDGDLEDAGLDGAEAEEVEDVTG